MCITREASDKQMDDVYIDDQSSTIHFIARLPHCVMTKKSADFVRCEDEICGILRFLEAMQDTNLNMSIAAQATKTRGIQRGSPFGSGFPIGASSIPVGTRFSVGKSSVLYLCGADGSRNCSTP